MMSLFTGLLIIGGIVIAGAVALVGGLGLLVWLAWAMRDLSAEARRRRGRPAR